MPPSRNGTRCASKLPPGKTFHLPESEWSSRPPSLEPSPTKCLSMTAQDWSPQPLSSVASSSPQVDCMPPPKAAAKSRFSAGSSDTEPEVRVPMGLE